MSPLSRRTPRSRCLHPSRKPGSNMEDASSRGKRETLICGHKPPTQAKAGTRGRSEKKKQRDRKERGEEKRKEQYKQEEAKRHQGRGPLGFPILECTVRTRQHASATTTTHPILARHDDNTMRPTSKDEGDSDCRALSGKWKWQCAPRGGTVVRAGMWCLPVGKKLPSTPVHESNHVMMDAVCFDNRRSSAYEVITSPRRGRAVKMQARRCVSGRRRGTARNIERTGQKDRQTDGHKTTNSM